MQEAKKVIEKEVQKIKRRNKSIRDKIMYSVLLLVCVSMGTLGIVTSVLNYASTNSTLEDLMTEAANITAQGIEYRLTASRNVVTEVGSIARLANPDMPLEDKKAMMEQKMETHGCENYGILDADGINIFNGDDLSEAVFFQEGMKGNSFVSPPRNITGDRMQIFVAAPLWKDGLYGTTVIGVVYLVPPETFLDEIVADVNISPNGSAYMLDATGTTIAHANHDNVLSGENTMEQAKTDKDLAKLASIEQMMVNGEEGFGSYWYGGKNKILAYAPVGGTNGWSVAVTAPLSDFMGSTILGMIITILFIAATIVASVVIIRKLAEGIGDPIRQCADRIKLLAKGDLQSPVPDIKREDEIGTLVKSTAVIVDGLQNVIQDMEYILSNMSKGNFDVDSKKPEYYLGDFEPLLEAQRTITQELSDTLKGIKNTAANVSLGSQQLADGAQALASGATDQASSVEEILATVNEVTDQVIKNAQEAATTSLNARQMETQTQYSTSQMNQMTDAMVRISDKSAQIGNIISSIEDIASQTNLLSLNASIEAARAGEAGRGFAVVAGEIGQLASQSAMAVDETRKLIEDTLQEVNNGDKIAKATVETLQELIQGLTGIIGGIETVGAACGQQSEMMKQLNIGIEQISGVVESNSAAAQETSATSEELSAQATAMNEIIKKFVVKE